MDFLGTATLFKLYDRVYLPCIRAFGNITKVRLDDVGAPIYTVTLDDPSMSTDGIMYTRDCEMINLA